MGLLSPCSCRGNSTQQASTPTVCRTSLDGCKANAQQQLFSSRLVQRYQQEKSPSSGKDKASVKAKSATIYLIQSLQSPRYLAHPYRSDQRSLPRCTVFSLTAKSTILLAATTLKNNKQRICSNGSQKESVAGNVPVFMYLRPATLRNPAVTSCSNEAPHERHG